MMHIAWWALRKLSLEMCLIKIVQSMYRNTRSYVRVKGTFSNDFLAQVGLRQGSVLSLLLFIIVLEVLSREVRSECPAEQLYADNLTLVKNLRT